MPDLQKPQTQDASVVAEREPTPVQDLGDLRQAAATTDHDLTPAVSDLRKTLQELKDAKASHESQTKVAAGAGVTLEQLKDELGVDVVTKQQVDEKAAAAQQAAHELHNRLLAQIGDISRLPPEVQALINQAGSIDLVEGAGGSIDDLMALTLIADEIMAYKADREGGAAGVDTDRESEAELDSPQEPSVAADVLAAGEEAELSESEKLQPGMEVVGANEAPQVTSSYAAALTGADVEGRVTIVPGDPNGRYARDRATKITVTNQDGKQDTYTIDPETMKSLGNDPLQKLKQIYKDAGPDGMTALRSELKELGSSRPEVIVQKNDIDIKYRTPNGDGVITVQRDAEGQVTGVVITYYPKEDPSVDAKKLGPARKATYPIDMTKKHGAENEGFIGALEFDPEAAVREALGKGGLLGLTRQLEAVATPRIIGKETEATTPDGRTEKITVGVDALSNRVVAGTPATRSTNLKDPSSGEPVATVKVTTEQWRPPPAPASLTGVEITDTLTGTVTRYKIDPRKAEEALGGKDINETIKELLKEKNYKKIVDLLNSIQPKDAKPTIEISNPNSPAIAEDIKMMRDAIHGIKTNPPLTPVGVDSDGRTQFKPAGELTRDSLRGRHTLAIMKNEAGQEMEIQKGLGDSYHVLLRGPKGTELTFSMKLSPGKSVEQQMKMVMAEFAKGGSFEHQLKVMATMDVNISTMKNLNLDNNSTVLVGLSARGAEIENCTFAGNATSLIAPGATFNGCTFKNGFRADGATLTGARFIGRNNFEGVVTFHRADMTNVDWGITNIPKDATVDCSTAKTGGMKSMLVPFMPPEQEKLPPRTQSAGAWVRSWFSPGAWAKYTETQAQLEKNYQAAVQRNQDRVEQRANATAPNLKSQLGGLIVDANRGSVQNAPGVLGKFDKVDPEEQKRSAERLKMTMDEVLKVLELTPLLKKHGVSMTVGKGVAQLTTKDGKVLCTLSPTKDGKIKIDVPDPQGKIKEGFSIVASPHEVLRSVTRRLTDGKFSFTRREKDGDGIRFVTVTITDEEAKMETPRRSTPAAPVKLDKLKTP